MITDSTVTSSGYNLSVIAVQKTEGDFFVSSIYFILTASPAFWSLSHFQTLFKVNFLPHIRLGKFWE